MCLGKILASVQPRGHKVIVKSRAGRGQHGTEDCCRAPLRGAWKWLQVRVRVQPLGWLSAAQAAAFVLSKSQEVSGGERR